MIKAIIFDLDGVLVDAREIHYEALNDSLARHSFTINREEHLSTYDGLSTKKKLKLLTEKKGLPPDLYDNIWQGKQDATFKILKRLGPDERIINLLRKLKEEGYKLCVCSNSIRESTKLMLLKRGFLEYIEFFLSNQDVVSPKPSPEIYLKAMINLGVKPKECIIVEDSHIGRRAAIDSGAYLCGVENSSGVTYENIKRIIDEAEHHNKYNNGHTKWQNKDMNIVIPLAGEGRSFKNAGYTFPKPLVEVDGKPMIQVAVENLNTEGKYIYIVKKEHYEKYNLKFLFELMTPGCKILLAEQPTKGAIDAVLLAKEHIDNDNPLVIANADQFLEWNSNEFFYSMSADECDGGIVTFKSNHPKWSYVKINKETGFAQEVAEKKPISDIATVGIYYYRRGKDFVKAAQKMIENNEHLNGEFYVAPAYNHLIKEGKKIRIFPVERMWGLGTPEDLNIFLDKYIK